jgi:hypothetical protein
LFLPFIFHFVIWNIHEAIHSLVGQLYYLLCLHPVLWLSLSAHACAMHTYLHLCMLKLLWIMEWCVFTLVCCESLLLPILLFIFHRRRIFMHDVLSFCCTKPSVWEKWYHPANDPYTVWCRFYNSSLGFGLMHWKFFHSHSFNVTKTSWFCF